MSFGIKGNKSLKKVFQKDKLCDFGNYWKKGTIIPLKKPYTDYDELLIKVGWDYGEGAAVEGQQHLRMVVGECQNFHVPVFLHSKVTFYLSLEFLPDNPMQAKISNSTCTKDDICIREIIGIKY